ncbi:ankyrin repeat-containing domain protein [Cercophora newfieldiana]|uniref:Ankyrin repeat-containing domain protein n=1 Tax=Cercophora newfieldiana TaxID=92897 RepID=A0AA39YFP1_9PEZI|nr:ankyrin repeat-containing domain protein [Cercophora newfieldiana]
MTEAESFYKYKPIDLATDAIRVLRLCRGYDTDPISCELAEIFLQDDGVPYEALSYTWGNTIVDVQVTLGGKKKMVKDNLYTALHCLRRADEDRWLWVDALCINQQDPQEKNHQVQRMRRIYEKADRVLIWLGRTTQEIDLLMEMMQQLGKRTRRRADYRKDDSTAWLEEWPQFVRELGGMETDFNMQRRNGLIEILKRPWFQRVWVLQEAFNAKRATILCGWNDVLTETFVVMPLLLSVEVEPHAQSVLDIMPGYLRRSSWRSQESNLQTLLRRFYKSEATDSRDKIYALLGIASDARDDGKLQADYAVPLPDAIRRAISYLMFGEGSYADTCPLPGWDFDTFIKHIDDLPARVLEWAINYGKETTAREVLARTNIDINSGPPEGQPPLLHLAKCAHYQHPAESQTILRMLLARDDININITDPSSGNNPLHVACEHGNLPVVAELLQRADIDPNAPNPQSFRTPLGLAAEFNRDLIAQHLLAHPLISIDAPNGRPDIRQFTPLWLAVSKGHLPVAQTLLAAGANVETRDTLEGEPALFVASKAGHLPTVATLLSHGADISARDAMLNAPPLWAAATHGHTPVFSLLLSHGAPLDDGRAVKTRQSVLWAAANAGHTDIVHAILDKGVTREYLELKDKYDRAPALWAAANKGHIEIVEALIEAGAEVGAQDCLGHTALWTAIRHQKVQVASILLGAGARLEPGDYVADGDLGYDPTRPARMAIPRGDVVKTLTGAGWDMEAIEGEIVRANSRASRAQVEWEYAVSSKQQQLEGPSGIF